MRRIRGLLGRELGRRHVPKKRQHCREGAGLWHPPLVSTQLVFSILPLGSTDSFKRRCSVLYSTDGSVINEGHTSIPISVLEALLFHVFTYLPPDKIVHCVRMWKKQTLSCYIRG